MASPFLFFIRFFSSFLQAYIFPVARTWQAQTLREEDKYYGIDNSWNVICSSIF